MMKKILAVVMLLSLLCCQMAFADEAKPLAGKTLTVAMSPDFMYFETVSETEPCGYEGLDIDILKSLSEKLGFEFVITPMSFSSLIGALQTNNADFVISGMSATEERAQVVDFSITYAETDFGVVVPVDSDIASYDDLKGKTICCSQGATLEQVIQNIEGAKLVTYQGQSAVGLAVAQQSDGVQAGMTSINGSKKLSNTVLTEAGEPMLKYFVLEYDGVSDIYNIAFPKGSELLPLFNDALQEMIDSGEMGDMIKKWLY
ncbi:MAG: transporter substrate-binding domain-containing protein [Clostridia bacterium]|nr:transporter substrate-binding domain-containing protein [Clostridia bacterium]